MSDTELLNQRNKQAIQNEFELIRKKMNEFQNKFKGQADTINNLINKISLLEKEIIMLKLHNRGSGPTST